MQQQCLLLHCIECNPFSRVLSALLSLTDLQVATGKLGAIQRIQGFAPSICFHIDKAITARPTGVAIRHDAHGVDLSVFFKQSAQLIALYAVGEVAYVEADCFAGVGGCG